MSEVAVAVLVSEVPATESCGETRMTIVTESFTASDATVQVTRVVAAGPAAVVQFP